MKRFSSLTCTAFLLTSCAHMGSLPPSEVLSKATTAASSLSAAEFSVLGSYTGTTPYMSGQFDVETAMNGTVTNGGQQLASSIDATIKRIDENRQLNTMKLKSALTVAGEHEAYLRIDTLTIDPPTPLLDPSFAETLIGKWFSIPNQKGASGSVTSTALTPDVAMLKLLAQVMTVTKDHGLTTIDKHSSYFYDVTIDHAKLLQYLTEVAKQSGEPAPAVDPLKDVAAKGQVWIDADDFSFRRIVWDLASSSSSPMSFHLDVRIRKQNDPSLRVIAPADAVPFPTSGNTSSLPISTPAP